MHSFISPDNNLVLLLLITGAAAFGIYSEHKKWFGKVSGILVTMISMSVLSMTGVIPVASNPKVKVDIYNLVFDYFIPIAIPLMLFSSNLGKIIRESGKLLVITSYSIHYTKLYDTDTRCRCGKYSGQYPLGSY